MNDPLKPPKHLAAATRRWWLHVVSSYELETHHVSLLTLAGEALDRADQARRALEKHGLTFTDRWDAPHSRPEVAIERDSRLAFARLLRELALDVIEPGTENRAPIIRGKHHMRIG